MKSIAEKEGAINNSKNSSREEVICLSENKRVINIYNVNNN